MDEKKIIESNSKKLKIINDMNQVAKKLGSKYHVFPNGLSIVPQDHGFIDRGFHFCVNSKYEKLNELLDTTRVMTFESQDVYKTIKDFKKNISHILIERDNIFLQTDGDKIRIGGLASINTIEKLKSQYNRAIKLINKDGSTRLTDGQVTSLYDNEMITLQKEDKRVRLTKQLFPNLRKDSEMSVNFFDLEDKKLFEVLLSYEKDNVQNYHAYTCIKF